jgi:hypothetical protein
VLLLSLLAGHIAAGCGRADPDFCQYLALAQVRRFDAASPDSSEFEELEHAAGMVCDRLPD